MKTNLTLIPGLLTAALSLPAFAQGTAFTYQGRLDDAGSPASGIYDLRFTIYDSTNSPGVVIVGPLTNTAAAVSNGLFTAMLDFGASAFDGSARFLEIAARPNGGGTFTVLAPRQPLTASPYAIRSLNSGLASTVVAGSINTTSLADGAVTGAKIAPGAVSQLGAADGSPTDAVVVDSTGRVGLGTNTPQAQLHVAGGDLLLGPGSNLSKQDSGGVTRALLLYDGNDNLQVLAPPDKTLALRTGTGGFTSVRATLTAAGRLGIGTATPDVLVHIQNGEVGASGSITASNLQLERTSDNWLSFMSPVNRLAGLAFSRPGSTATELFHGAILYNESTLPDSLQFRTGGNFTRLTIAGNGEVGIGTTNPAAELHVLGGTTSGAAFQAGDVLAVEGGTLPAVAIGMPAAGSGLFRFSKPSRSDAAKIQYNAATGQLFMLSDGAVFFGTDSGSGFTARMTVANDGDVGIGTLAPAARLHVVASPSGNSSVILPNNSISAAEILDEPGVAGLVYSGPDVPIDAAFPDPPESVLSQSITAPAAGYVLALATIGSRHVSTGAATARWGLTTNTSSIPADAFMLVEFQPAGSAGLWSMPVTLHRLFPVSAGATTVHVMAQTFFGSTEFGKAQLSLIYIPTTYGTVPAAVLPGGSVGSASIQAPSSESAAASDMAALLEQVRAERAALQADLESLRNLKADLAASGAASARSR